MRTTGEVRRLRRALGALAFLLVALGRPQAIDAQAPADTADGLRSGPLFVALARMDSALFDATFASCDASKANAIFTDDVEFYHDQTGLATRDQVRDNTRRLTASCPRSQGVTRTLVAGSLRVYPIANYGAVQMGVHRFDERGASTSTVTRFVHVWRLVDGAWRLARVLSLDHHPVPARTDTLPARVDGRRIHMVAAGQGGPTVVLEAGFSSTSRTWSNVQRELARTHRVVAYDRAGLGASAASSQARTSRAIVEDLRAALRSVGLGPPYILVGHSAGGLHARMFAGLYPAEVAGLVLVDPAPEDFYARAKREQPVAFAYLDSIDKATYSAGSPGELAEDAQWDRALEEVRETEGRYAGPVVLLSSARADLRELGPIWTDEHRRWVARAARREYVLVDGAGHNIHRERPELVLEAVRRVLSRP